MTPSPNSLLRTASSDDLLCRLLSSDLNIQADSSAEQAASKRKALGQVNILPTSRYSSPDARLQGEDRDDTLDQLLDSELNHPPSPSPSPSILADQTLDQLLDSELNRPPSPSPSNIRADQTLDELLDSELNRPPSPSPSNIRADQTLDQLLDSELNRPPSPSPSNIRADHTLDQLLDSDLNRPPSPSPSPSNTRTTVPKPLSAFLQLVTTSSKEHESWKVLMGSGTRYSPIIVDDVESEESEGSEGSEELMDQEIDDTSSGLSFPSSPTGEEYSQQEFFQLESRLYEMVGQWRNREVDDAENMKVLLEKKRYLTARYAEVIRDKMTLWDITEQLEVAEASLMRRL